MTGATRTRLVPLIALWSIAGIGLGLAAILAGLASSAESSYTAEVAPAALAAWSLVMLIVGAPALAGALVLTGIRAMLRAAGFHGV